MNPFQWMQDPNRRADYYDPSLTLEGAQDSEALKGFAGAAGRVEGIVRVLNGPEEGESLKTGEILVASTTNVVATFGKHIFSKLKSPLCR